MLKYLITVTEGLLFAGLMTGLFFALAGRMSGRAGRIAMTSGAVLGLVAAAVMSWYKNNTKLIETNTWNLHIVAATTALMLLFFLFLLLKWVKPIRKAMSLCACVSGALLLAGWLFYTLPDVYAYPTQFVSSSESVLSTDFLYKLIGWLWGLLLVGLLALAAHRTSRGARGWWVTVCAVCGAFFMQLQLDCKSIQFMRLKYDAIKQAVPFSAVKLATQYVTRAIYLAIVLAVILALCVIVRTLRAREPYDNPAQHRLIRAKWRTHRRWAILLLCCALFGLLTETAIKEYVNRPAPSAPTEEVEVVDGEIHVDLTLVEDGHLHRFGYVTESGKTIRFIVIKKPNSQAYGVGLDACDICGEAGYYERSGQVVCRRCDVVMNINTIGFKGGCNPIVFEYTVKDGVLIIPVQNLLPYEKKFK